MKLLKNVGIFLLALILLIIVLFVYWSSANLDESQQVNMVVYGDLQEGDSALVAMTYNIGYLSGMTNNQSIKREYDFFERNLRAAKGLTQSLQVDVIGFQEIDFASSRSFEINQLDTLAKAGEYMAAYRSVNWDKRYVPFPYWPPSNHFGRMLSGQAILSKYPLKGIETIRLTPRQDAPKYYQAFYLDRLLQLAEMDFLGEKVVIMNVHLEAFDQATRLAQTEIVRHEYEKFAAKQPVILLGDFNSRTPSKSAEVDAIQLLMGAPWIASAIKFEDEAKSGSYSSASPEKMIDYIFYNKNFLTCLDSRVVTEAGQISDHLPVLASFALKQQVR